MKFPKRPGPDPDASIRHCLSNLVTAGGANWPRASVGQGHGGARLGAEATHYASMPGLNGYLLRPGRHTPELHPRYLDVVVGRRAARDLGPGEGIGVDAAEPNIDLRA